VAEAAQPGSQSVNVDVRFQTCASMCLAPTDLELTAELIITVPGQGDPVEDRSGEPLFAGFDDSAWPEQTAGGPGGGATEVDPGPQTVPDENPQATTPEGSATDQSDDKPTEAGPAPASAQSNDSNRISGQVLGFSYDVDGNGPLAILFAVLLAFVGGTVLNLMPCVLPIIPIKIMGLTQAAGNRRKSAILGAFMFAGVVSLWLVLGFAVASLTKITSANSLFQMPLFGLGVGAFIIAMAIGMMGAFAVGLPQWVYRINPKHDSPVGAFGFGVMAAVLSTPCTAPFMGASMTWATQQEGTLVVLAVFTAIGLGMGWPYVVLSAYPKLVEKIPRTGPASEVVKQVLGLLMLAAGVFFAASGLIGLLAQYPYLGPALHWWIITLLLGATAFWLSYRTFQLSPSLGRRVFFTLIGLALFAGAGMFGLSQTRIERVKYFGELQAEHDRRERYHTLTQKVVELGGREALDELGFTFPAWAPYNADEFAQARQDGKITVVDFTAVW